MPGTALRARFIRNAGWLGAGLVANRLLGFAAVLLLARALGATAFGWLGIAGAVGGMVALLGRGGLAPRAVREGARDPQAIARGYGDIAGLRLVWGGCLIALCAFAVPYVAPHLGVPNDLLYAYLLTAVPGLLGVQWAFQAIERMEAIAVSESLFRVLTLLGALVIFVGWVRALVWVPLVEVAAGLTVVALMTTRLSRRVGRLRPVFAPRRWGPLAAEGIPTTANLLLRLVFSEGGAVILGVLASASQAGLYLVSHKLILAFTVVPVVLQEAAFPGLCRAMHVTVERAIDLQRTLIRLTLLLVMPVVVIFALGAEPLLVGVFGAGYAEAVPALQIGAFTLPLFVLGAASRRMLLAAAKPKALLVTSALAAAFHIAFAIWLVPSHGAAGAAAACVVGELVAAAALLLALRSLCRALPLEWAHGVPLVAALAMAATWVVLGQYPLGFRLAGGIVVYTVVALAFGALRADEWRSLRSILGRRGASG